MLGSTIAGALLRRKWNSNGVSVQWFSSSKRVKAPLDMAARDGELRLFIVAGEVSGDSIASRLMASLKLLSPFPVRFAGVGGAKMSHEGLQSLFPINDISVMGIWELLPHLYRIRVRLKETVEAAAIFEPHVVLTVDSKGFSFRFLKRLRGTNEPTLLEKCCMIIFERYAVCKWGNAFCS